MIQIRLIDSSDEAEYLKNYNTNKHALKPWVQVPKTSEEFSEYVKEMRSEENKAFVAIDQNINKMVGIVELRDIFMHDFKNSYIIYFGFKEHLGKGSMTRAVSLVIRQAFSKLKLHRLEANIQPNNHASLELARRCGFQREGYSPKFIKKNGKWKDHERWAILSK